MTFQMSEPKYFTIIPKNLKLPKRNDRLILRATRVEFTLPCLGGKDGENLLLRLIFDLIRNGVAHQYQQPLVDLLNGEKFYITLIGPSYGNHLRGIRSPDYVSCDIDRNDHISLKVCPDVLFLDFQRAVDQSGILGRNLDISHLEREYDTNVQTLESALNTGGHQCAKRRPVRTYPLLYFPASIHVYEAV
jgi:hypothetical protein